MSRPDADAAAGINPQTVAAMLRITDAALAYLPEQRLLTELLSRVAEILTVDTVAMLLVEGDVLRARAAKGIEEEVQQGVRIPLGRGFAGRIAAERRAIVIDDIADADIYNPILRQKGIRSLLGVPLLVEGRVLGVLHVGSLTARHFSQEDSAVLQLAADRVAPVLAQARLYEHRLVAETLQRRLLPARLSQPGLELASRYLPAAGSSLGGDWYDAFAVDAGRIALVIGDVAGHGLEAAATMSQLRTALRAYAIEHQSPATVIQRVNQLMCRLGPTVMTTLAYLVLDPAAGTLEYVNAGHPPPLVISPGHAPRYLAQRGGIVLGAGADAAYRSTTHEVAPGSIVLLYTDGLIERRHEPLDAGLQRLRALARGVTDVDDLCAILLERLVPAAPEDDIAFIAARTTARESVERS